MAFNITYNGLQLGSGTGYHLQDVQGLSSPVVRTSSADNTNKNGGSIYSQLYSMRVVTTEVIIVGTSVDDYFTKKRALEYAFTKDATDRTLTIDDWNGGQRTLSDCYVTTSPVHKVEPAKTTVGNFYIELTAGEPFFSDGDTDTFSATLSDGGGFPLPAPLPFPLGGSSNNSFVIDNTGDIGAFAEFFIYGQVVNPTVTSSTTGESFSLDTTIADGDYVHVYMTNHGEVVLKNDSVNLLSTFTGNIPTIRVGSNTILFSATSGGGSAELTATWSNRYLSL